ncbi:hypothetical protein J6590_074902 [Homalodisca vitripennis]|nr:hypothetical protein J6590_074902 [Homalodisca vitripennis]
MSQSKKEKCILCTCVVIIPELISTSLDQVLEDVRIVEILPIPLQNPNEYNNYKYYYTTSKHTQGRSSPFRMSLYEEEECILCTCVVIILELISTSLD